MSSAVEEGLARIAIDRGGTFTDAICSRKGHPDIVIKVCPLLAALRVSALSQRPRPPLTPQLLSVDPANYKDAPTEA